jgi:NAD(P)-dependent dehydrogenase (short-subunit alcohol dehydrogenase family)
MDALDGKVAVVTGAASGIGLAFGEALLEAGMRVVLADIDSKRLAAEVARLRHQGADVLGVETDVGDQGAVEALGEKAVSTFGAVHVVCNNAGLLDAALTWERPLADWDRILRTNLGGAIHGVRTFVPILLASGEEGHILNVASVAAFEPRPGIAPYNISKSGIVALSETLAMELDAVGAPVRVSVVVPGSVVTRLARSIRSAEELDLSAVQPGMRTPADIASQMVQAVRRGWFYVLTHPERYPAIERRAHGVLDGLRGDGSRSFVAPPDPDAIQGSIAAASRRSPTKTVTN